MLWFRVKSAGGACSQKRRIAPRSDRLLAGKNGDFGNLFGLSHSFDVARPKGCLLPWWILMCMKLGFIAKIALCLSLVSIFTGCKPTVSNDEVARVWHTFGMAWELRATSLAVAPPYTQ